jgi:hypothetical protein
VMSMRLQFLSALLALSVSACGGRGVESGDVESGLRSGLERAYGPVNTISCHKNDEVQPHGDLTLYDCDVAFADGQQATLCGFLTEGVPGWNQGPCAESRLAQ